MPRFTPHSLPLAGDRPGGRGPLQSQFYMSVLTYAALASGDVFVLKVNSTVSNFYSCHVKFGVCLPKV
jgi:hypothetical protein